MKHSSFLWSPDGAAAPVSSAVKPVKKPKTRGAFDREVAADLSEALKIVAAARLPQFAPILLDPFGVTAAFVSDLEAKILAAQEKFGLAAGGAAGGKVSTAEKQRLEDVLDAAIRRVQTGARLTYPNSLADQARWGVGIPLEDAEDQVELLVPRLLGQLVTEPLRSVTPAIVAALQSAFDAWMTAGGAQSQAKLDSQTDRKTGYALLSQVEPMVREIKICIDGQFPYDAPDTPDLIIQTIRKQFFLPEHKPYVYVPREN